jgi:hypothetical protein
MLKNLLKLYCIWTWDTLWVFFLCAILFYFMRPFWWDNYRTTSEAPSPGLEAEMDTKIIKTETSLHLNLGFFFLFFILFSFNFYTFFLSFIIFYFYSYLYSFYFIFHFQSSLCLSNAFSAYGRLVHCLSQFMSLKLHLFVSLFCWVFFFLLDYLFFPFPWTSLLSIPSHPSILNITSAIIIRQKILNCTQYRDNNNTKQWGEDRKNRETSFPTAKN